MKKSNQSTSISKKTEENDLYIKKSKQSSKTNLIVSSLFSLGGIINLLWYNRPVWCIR